MAEANLHIEKRKPARDLGTIIAAYRKKLHLTQAALSQRLTLYDIHVSSKAISNWEKGLTEPSATTFLCLCRILRIPDFLEEYFGENPADPISALNDEGKLLAISYINRLLHPINYSKNGSSDSTPLPPSTGFSSEGDLTAKAYRPMRRIKLFDARVSAGTGDFLSSEDYSYIEIDESLHKDCDFAVTIHGDSMEPAFHDHEMVFIHQQNTLEDGEIGIFAWENNAYIKKLREDSEGLFLVSLNPHYQPIRVDPADDSFRIFGKVCL